MSHSDSDSEQRGARANYEDAIREIKIKEKELTERTRMLENMMQTFANYLPKANVSEPCATTSTIPPPPINFQTPTLQTSTPGTNASGFSYPPAYPKSYLRDALELVPKYDGHNLPVWQFARACKRAKETVPMVDEAMFVRMLRNKLTHHAYLAVEDEMHPTVEKFLDSLKRSFGTGKSSNYYRGQLSMTFKKPNEHVIDYIGRVKDLKTAIIEGDQTSFGRQLSEVEIASIESFALEAFLEGLPRDYRTELRAEGYSNLNDACSKTIMIDRRLQREELRYKNVRPSRDNSAPLPTQTLQHSSTAPPNDSFLNPVAPGNQKICGFCKKFGHLINECRKRQNQQYFHSNNNYNNYRPTNGNTNNNNNSSNYNSNRPTYGNNNNSSYNNNNRPTNGATNTNNNGYNNNNPNSNNAPIVSGNSTGASANGTPRGQWNVRPVTAMETNQGISMSYEETMVGYHPSNSNQSLFADQPPSCSTQEHSPT